jgi:fructose-specific phosphotransferase system IIA component
MALMDLIDERAVKAPLEALDKEGVIKELSELLAEHGNVGDANALISAVWEREGMGSTGLDDGIAVPHGKSAAVRSLGVAIGIAPQGVDFGAADGKLSKIFFLMAAPLDHPGPHIETLAEIARLSHSKALIKALASAKSAEEVLSLLKGD